MKRFAALALALTLCLFSLPVLSEGIDDALTIVLSDHGIEADYPGVYTAGNALIITLPGDYFLTGSLTDGQIVVDSGERGKVRLFLGGIDVHCENGPALYIKKCAPRLTIDLVEGTVNTLTDGKAYNESNDNADAVIFSKSDLTITGKGALKVIGSYRAGIVSKDDLRIKGGEIDIQAVHNGLCGKDYVEIYDGKITVSAGNDGIKTTGEDPQEGYIRMEGGTVNVTAGDDPISFVSEFTLLGGTISMKVDTSLAAE